MQWIFRNKRDKETILVFLLFFILFQPGLFAQDPEPYRIRTVVIDPGHGGKDCGSLGKFSQEKDIALAISLKVGNYIKANLPDVKVLYTRNTDIFIPLDERAEVANRNKADLFMSIHANGVDNPSAYGSETWVMGLHANAINLEIAMKENSVISLEDDYTSRYEGYDPNSAESFIIFNLVQNTHLEQSLDFASRVQQEFNERARRRDRGVKQAGFIVLWRSTVPSVLIETGFITNKEEEKYLNSEQGQDYLASAIYRAFRDYKTAMETQIDMVQAQTSPTPLTEIRFKVQVTVSGKPIPLDDKMFDGFSKLEEFEVNGIYKYAVGEESRYDLISEYCTEVRKHFPDAFVIGIKGSEIIPLSEAIRESGQ